MSSRVEQFVRRIIDTGAGTTDELPTGWIDQAPPDETSQLMRAIAGTIRDGSDVCSRSVTSALEQLHMWASRPGACANDELRTGIGDLYGALQSIQVPRSHLLTMLTTLGTRQDLILFSELVLTDPPASAVEVTAAFMPLFQRENGIVVNLFPRLLDGLANRELAPVILDLANHVTRRQLVDRHPAELRVSQLKTLLEGLVGGLEQLERLAAARQPVDETDQRQFVDSVALAISLCDALALIGDQSAVGPLRRLAELQHRRLRVEAWAALARLGETGARQQLAAMADEPATRLRVLAYADEIDALVDVDEDYRSPVAIAHAELVAYLTLPTSMGIPPSQCELIDTRTQYWPGYDEPRVCFLFRFSYRAINDQQQEVEYSNIGIAGPLLHAFTVDLGDLSIDDIYAAYAGWQAEHEEILELDIAGLTAAQSSVVEQLRQRIADEGYGGVTPIRLGLFFGTHLLVCGARKQGVEGVAVVDDRTVYWHPRRTARPLGPDVAYSIYKGRRLLRAFN